MQGTDGESRAARLACQSTLTPARVLLDEIHWMAGHVAWLREKVQELEADELIWARSSTKTASGPKEWWT